MLVCVKTHMILVRKEQLANPQVMDAMSSGSVFVSHHPPDIFKQICNLDINQPEYEPKFASYFVHRGGIIIPLRQPMNLLDPSRPISMQCTVQ